MAKKLFSGTKRYDRDRNVTEKANLLPGLSVHHLFSRGSVDEIILKNSEFINLPGTCSLKRFLLQPTNFISWLDFSFCYSVKPNIEQDETLRT